MPTAVTVKDVEDLRRPDRASDYRVLLWDQAFPSQEIEFLLREGETWARGSVLEVASFTLRERHGAEARINASLMKTVPLGRWIAVAVGAASDLRDGRPTEIWTTENPEAMRPRVEPTPTHTNWKLGKGPDYEAVGLIYRISLRSGSRNAAEEVAMAFDILPSLAAHWISRARYLGFLGAIAPRETPVARANQQIVPSQRNKGPR